MRKDNLNKDWERVCMIWCMYNLYIVDWYGLVITCLKGSSFSNVDPEERPTIGYCGSWSYQSLTHGPRKTLVEMLFHFFICPHSSPFVIRLKKPTGHWLSIQFAAPNWLDNQWSVSCLRRMTNGDEQKSETTSQLMEAPSTDAWVQLFLMAFHDKSR